jgi:hypothetical protein
MRQRRLTANTRANKTDAGNGSKAICRVSNVLRSPSPDPRRSAKKQVCRTATLKMSNPLHASIVGSFERSFGLYRDLVSSLDESSLLSDLPSLPSNTIGLQLWCVIGARESYTRAIRANQWSGFACSLESVSQKAPVVDALSSSSEQILNLLNSVDSFTDTQCRMILDLLEHEAAHHGQLIRYLFALRLTIPESWKSRYSL